MARWSTRVAWVLLVIFMACMGVVVPLSVANGNFQRGTDFAVAYLLAVAAFMVVGAMIVAHRPGNAIGWIFSAVGLFAATGWLAVEYAEFAYVTRPGSLPGAVVAAWFQWWWLPLGALILVFTPLLFPTGRLLSTRWRWVALVATTATLAIVVLGALRPILTLQNEDYAIRNPIGVAGLPSSENGAVGSVLFWVLASCAVAAVLSLALRFRRSRGEERQQLKWFTYSAALILTFQALITVVPSFVPDSLGWLLIALLPLSAGIAIMRYRLYDIDRVINRTVVYGLLTAVLIVGYAGVVLGLGEVVGGAGSDRPSWVVAAATLAVAAVFQPARVRIQDTVDRRFNRQKYDAAKTVGAFGATLRHEIDLDSLSTELLSVVDQTVQPTHTSLWRRPPAQPSPRFVTRDDAVSSENARRSGQY